SSLYIVITIKIILGIAVINTFIVRYDFFFFFQAEDGIRDATVTGVQTCALPISRRGNDAVRRIPCEVQPAADHAIEERDCPRVRSEERRVGKECRCRWGRDD